MNGALMSAASGVPALLWMAHAWWLGRRLDTARRDPLTGLHTRDAFTHRAVRLLGRPGAIVVLVDLNGFKRVNDTHGHAAGDAVLRAVAGRLSSWAGPGAAVGRIGGDEFAVVRDLRTGYPGYAVAELHRWLREPVEFGDAVLPSAGAVGAVGAVRELSTALAVADDAMYESKRLGTPVFLPGVPAGAPSGATVRRAGSRGGAR